MDNGIYGPSLAEIGRLAEAAIFGALSETYRRLRIGGLPLPGAGAETFSR